MSEAPIILEQVIEINGLETQFSTSPDISNKILLRFYDDLNQIIKELDSEINYDGKTYINLHGGIWWPFGFFLKIQNINKSLQVRKGEPQKFNIDNVIRTHNILYRRNPKDLSNEMKERIENNMFKEFLLFKPNIQIMSTSPIYSADDLVKRIKDLPYIEISDKCSSHVFNPHKLTIALKKELCDLTSTKRIPTRH